MPGKGRGQCSLKSSAHSAPPPFPARSSFASTPNAYKNFVDPDLKSGLDMILALLLAGHAQGLSSTREERVIAF
jgi:hypothetical protein